MALKAMGDETEVSAQSGRLRVVDPLAAHPQQNAAPAGRGGVIDGFASPEVKVSSLRALGKFPETQEWTLVDAVWEKTGLPVTVKFRDLGDSLVAVDPRGLVYEAYTTEFQVDRARSYVQTDRARVESAGVAARLAHYREHLQGLGILAWQFGGAKVTEKFAKAGFQQSARIELVTSTTVPAGAVELRDADGKLIGVLHGVAEIRAGFAD